VFYTKNFQKKEVKNWISACLPPVGGLFPSMQGLSKKKAGGKETSKSARAE